MPRASAPRSERKRVEKATGPLQGRYVRSSKGKRVGDVPLPDVIDSSETPSLEPSLMFRGGDSAIRGGRVPLNETPRSNTSLVIPLSYILRVQQCVC